MKQNAVSLKTVIEPATVLFGKLNPRVPKVWLVGPASGRRKIASTEFIPLRPLPSKIDSGFLYFLCWSDFVMARAAELVSGSTPSRQRVDPSSFLALMVPLPPLPEQRAIARVLRTVQRAREQTEAVIAATRQLKASLLHHLFTYGPVPIDQADQVPLKETEIGAVPEHWEVVKLSEAISGAQYGLSLRGGQGGRYPILRMTNLHDGQVKPTHLQYVDIDDRTLGKFVLRDGDILFNRTNSFELVGKTAIFELPGDYVFASYLVRVIPGRSRIAPHYLNSYLNLDSTQARLKQLASRAVSQSNINATKLKSLLIAIPPLSEQHQMIARLRAIACKLETEQARQRALDTLFTTLLHDLMTAQVRANQIPVLDC